MKNILFIVIITFTIMSSAQEHKSNDKILQTYLTELNLNKQQSEQFIVIYLKYKPLLTRKSISNSEFNKLNKERDLEFSNLFTEKDRTLYRNLKRKLEPDFGFRM